MLTELTERLKPRNDDDDDDDEQDEDEDYDETRSMSKQSGKRASE